YLIELCIARSYKHFEQGRRVVFLNIFKRHYRLAFKNRFLNVLLVDGKCNNLVVTINFEVVGRNLRYIARAKYYQLCHTTKIRVFANKKGSHSESLSIVL